MTITVQPLQQNGSFIALLFTSLKSCVIKIGMICYPCTVLSSTCFCSNEDHPSSIEASISQGEASCSGTSSHTVTEETVINERDHQEAETTTQETVEADLNQELTVATPAKRMRTKRQQRRLDRFAEYVSC